MKDDEWRLLDLSYQSPFLNLALEEALLRCCELESFVPTLRIWVNGPSTVLGRFQDVSIEVDMQLCAREGIHIVRRFTGGGTVYHDNGNLNFTIINKRLGIDLATVQLLNTTLVRKTLSKLGVESVISRPNALIVEGHKISGSAAAVSRGFLLWHASLLVSTDLKLLERVLSPSKRMIQTGHVRSNWLPTTSLQQLRGKTIQISKVKRNFLESMHEVLGVEPTIGSLSSHEKTTVQALHASKYSIDSWNLHGQELSPLAAHASRSSS